jgi:hypothetical protein
MKVIFLLNSDLSYKDKRIGMVTEIEGNCTIKAA